MKLNIINNFNILENKTISLVCNSGSLLDRNYSEEIDDSDLVVRMNNGNFLFGKFPDKVGKRNDICCLNGYYGFPEEQTKPTLEGFLQSNYKMVLFTRNINDIDKKYLEKCSKENIEIIFPNFENVIINNISIPIIQISSGLIAALFLSHFKNNRLKIFGMDFYSDEKKHFYNNSHKDMNSHDWKIENLLLEQIKKNNDNIKHFI